MQSFNIFPNQSILGQEICDLFLGQNKYVILNAQPQSGKTGVAKSVVYLLQRDPKYQDLEIHNYWFLSAMNDNGLKDQHTREFSGLIHSENILMNNQLQDLNFKQKYTRNRNPIPSEKFTNALFILDESHYGQNVNDTESQVYQFFTKCVGVYLDGVPSDPKDSIQFARKKGNNPEDGEKSLFQIRLKDKNIYVLSISATSMSEIAHLPRESVKKEQLVLHPNPGYYSFYRQLQLDRIHQSANLNTESGQDEFVDILNIEWLKQSTDQEYRYVLVRFNNSVKGRLVRELLIDRIHQEISPKISFLSFHSKEREDANINDLISQPPKAMTIIEIYNSLRAGYQLNTQWVGLVHETYNAPVDVTAQGLPGRICGYGKEAHAVENYCNLGAILNYINLVKRDFDPNFIPNKCKNIKTGYTLKTDDFEKFLDIKPDQVTGNPDLAKATTIKEKRPFIPNIPIGGRMSQTLVDRLLEYKRQHKKTYPNFLSEFKDDFIVEKFNSKMNNGEMIIDLDLIFKEYHFVGVTILDESNIVNDKTDTWTKFWKPSINGLHESRPVCPFKNAKLPKDKKAFFYLYINLKVNHPEFGYFICVSKRERDSYDPEFDIMKMTTGFEQYYPENLKITINSL